MSKSWHAQTQGSGVVVETPNGLPTAAALAATYNTDGSFAGWVDPSAGGGGAPPGSDNELITNDGAGGFVSEGNLKFDEAKLFVAGSTPGAAVHIRNLLATGFSGAELQKTSGAFGAFFGYQESTNHMRFNIDSGGVHRFFVNSVQLAEFADTGTVLDITAPASTTGLQITADATPGDYLDLKDSSGTTQFKVSDEGVQLTPGASTTGLLITPDAGTPGAHINLAASTAPAAPNDGDIWNDGNDLFVRLGGVTYTLQKV
jgi:hypothetical protein